MEKTHMHGAKESQNFIVKLFQCSQSGRQEPHKAKLLQDAPFNKQKHCHTAHVAHKPAFMAQCSHKERLHCYHEEVHSSSLPCSICHPAEKKRT